MGITGLRVEDAPPRHEEFYGLLLAARCPARARVNDAGMLDSSLVMDPDGDLATQGRMQPWAMGDS